MHKFCTKCGNQLNADGTCPNCDREDLNTNNNWFKPASDLGDPTPESTQPVEPLKPSIPEEIPYEEHLPLQPVPPAKPKTKAKKVAIITACIVLVAVIAGGLVWFLWPKSDDVSTSEQDAPKTQEQYLAELSEYVTVGEPDVITNEYGETIASAEVECPDYSNIYKDAYDKIDIQDDDTNAEIDVKFFSEVSELLEDNDEFIIVEISCNLNEEDFEKTENNSWTDEEIIKILRQKVAVDAFEEFCLDIIMENAPEITEEGLMGEE